MKTSYPLTSKSQITVPKHIRAHLGLQAGDRAQYRIKANGEVVINRPPTIAEIRAKVGRPSGKQPLTDHERLIISQISER